MSGKDGENFAEHDHFALMTQRTQLEAMGAAQRDAALRVTGSRGPRVVYWNNIPAPYMVERFNCVARRGNLEFVAWFDSRRHPDWSWDVDEGAWLFRYRYLPSFQFAGQRFSLPVDLLKSELPDLMVSLYAEPSFLLGWSLAKMRGVRTAFWAEITFDRWQVRKRWKEALKRKLFPRADGIITAGKQGRDFAERYGAVRQRICLVPHSIDVDHFARESAAARPTRDRFRKELGLIGFTFIYVGRLWWGKGLYHLINAFGALQRRSNEPLSLLMVGNGPEEIRLREHCRDQSVKNVVFPGFMQKSEIPRYYAAGDAFVFPTLGDPYGLVVDEAMACSLPVVCTNAAGEIRERIDDAVSGFIVEADDSASLLVPMEKLASDPQLRVTMGRAAAAKVVSRTPERWAQDFENAVDTILSASAVRNEN